MYEGVVPVQEGEVTTICYGCTRVWNNSYEAEDFFMDCIRNSDGCERERYSKIYLSLLDGMQICTDED